MSGFRRDAGRGEAVEVSARMADTESGDGLSAAARGEEEAVVGVED